MAGSSFFSFLASALGAVVALGSALGASSEALVVDLGSAGFSFDGLALGAMVYGSILGADSSGAGFSGALAGIASTLGEIV